MSSTCKLEPNGVVLVPTYDGYRRETAQESACRLRNERMAAARAQGTHTKAQWIEMRRVYGRCLRCGIQDRDDTFLVKDHIVPVYQGGSDGIDNLQPLCPGCNGSKGPERIDFRIGQPETRPEWLPRNA